VVPRIDAARGRLDGGVEAVVQGSRDAVEAIERWAHRGPDHAAVADVEATDADGDYTRFEKRPTG